VFNKTDRLSNGAGELANLCRRFGAVAVSALRGEGLAQLVAEADRRLGEKALTDERQLTYVTGGWPVDRT
jgi:50S ribosomal subunit-associated GTPase HflX